MTPLRTRASRPTRAGYIGPYELLDRLGEGPSGTTFRARDLELDRLVACKVVHDDHLVTTAQRSRFARRLERALPVDSRYTVPVLDIVVDGTRVGIVSELQASSLLGALEREVQFTPSEALRMAGQLARGLAAIHSGGVRHEFLTPTNVLIGADGIARIGDVGVTALLAEITGLPLTDPRFSLDSLAFLAPEIWTGTVATSAADMYSLGMIVYQMVVGWPAFSGEFEDLRLSHLVHEPQQPSEVPEDLHEVIASLVAKTPMDRFPRIAVTAVESGDVAGQVSALVTALAARYALEPRVPRPRVPLEPVRTKRPWPITGGTAISSESPPGNSMTEPPSPASSKPSTTPAPEAVEPHGDGSETGGSADSPIRIPTSFGRVGSGADVEIADDSVAPDHAVALPIDGTLDWRLRRRQGSLAVSGKSVGEARLSPGDVFVIGQSVVRVPSPGRAWQTNRVRRPTGTHLVVEGLRVVVGDRQVIRSIDFSAEPNTLSVILGPSGTGKTTLIRAMLGEITPAEGRIEFDGGSLTEPLGSVPPATAVRYVPQVDALHSRLTVRKNLRYAAALRAAPTSPLSVTDERIRELAALVHLEDFIDRRVETLSGGQRKRLSIAVELSTRPRLLILDEPGAGLDAGLDRDLMVLLHERAAEGSTVLCVTHNVTSLDRADQAIVLAADKGARTAYFGPPAEATAAIGGGDWAGAYHELSGPSAPLAPPHPQALPPTPSRLRSPLRTWLLLVSREADQILARGKANLPNVLLPVLGAVLAVLASHTGWVGVPDPSQAVTLLATVSVLAGTALTYAEVVHELPTIRREYRIGVSGLQVIVAKLTAAIALLIPMTALLVIFYALLRPVGGATKLTVVPAIVGLLFPLFMAGVASAAAGLVVSAASPHLQRAVGLSTALAIMQVALNGTLIPLGPAGRMISILVPARLAVAAQRAFLGGASGHASHDALWKHQASTWAIDLLLLAVLCVLFTVAAGAVLDRRCRTPE